MSKVTQLVNIKAGMGILVFFISKLNYPMISPHTLQIKYAPLPGVWFFCTPDLSGALSAVGRRLLGVRLASWSLVVIIIEWNGMDYIILSLLDLNLLQSLPLSPKLGHYGRLVTNDK